MALVTVLTGHPLGSLSRDLLGTNLLAADPHSGAASTRAVLQQAEIALVRWPGGGDADRYLWASNAFAPCPGRTAKRLAPGVAFDAWMQSIAVPLQLDVAVTLNYGSTASCRAGGDAAYAAAWVRDAKAHGYGVRYWTIGNEPYFASEIDRNVPAHDARMYARRIATEFYPKIKAADPHALVGVAMALGSLNGSSAGDVWDETVLAQARYDFVEIHFYPSYGNTSDDRTVLTDDVAWLARIFAQAREMLQRYGHANAPIVLGEFDRDSGSKPADTPGHETLSIVDALFTDEVIGEAANAHVPVAASWLGIDRLFPDPVPSPRAYGWQSYGSWGLAESGSVQRLFPKTRAYQVAAAFFGAGGQVLATTCDDSAIRAYAAKRSDGYAVLLVNTDGEHAHAIDLALESASPSRFAMTTTSYGKGEYDRSRYGVWAGVVRTNLGSIALPHRFLLPPWSATAVELRAK
jgi:hypothetical protein